MFFIVVYCCCFYFQVGLLLISGVVPVLQTARLGVDVDIANVLAGFKIMLSPDKHEVVRIVVYYIWCVEGGWDKACKKANVFFIRAFMMSLMGSIANQPNMLSSVCCSMLHICHDPVWFGQPGYAHEVHGSASVRKQQDNRLAGLLFFYHVSIPCQTCSRSRECASFSFIIMQWLTEELLWHNKELITRRDRKTFPPR